MRQTKIWLMGLKGPTFHPLVPPMIFAEFERKRLFNMLERKNTEVAQGILDMENKIKHDEQTAGKRLGPGLIQAITQKDCDSTKLWLSISKLKNGLESLKTQLASMSKHARMLSDTVFTEVEGEHDRQRESGARVDSRIQEIIAEIESKVRTCDGLLGGMTLSMQMVSEPNHTDDHTSCHHG